MSGCCISRVNYSAWPSPCSCSKQVWVCPHSRHTCITGPLSSQAYLNIERFRCFMPWIYFFLISVTGRYLFLPWYGLLMGHSSLRASPPLAWSTFLQDSLSTCVPSNVFHVSSITPHISPNIFLRLSPLHLLGTPLHIHFVLFSCSFLDYELFEAKIFPFLITSP